MSPRPEQLVSARRTPGREQPDSFFYLFAALLLLIVLGPTLTTSLGDSGVLIGELTLTASLVVALGSLRTSRRNFWVGTALVAAHIVNVVASFYFRNETWALIAVASAIVFLSMSALVAAVQVFRQDRVDLNKVMGALCVYLLLGVIFALLYLMIGGLMPGSLSGLDDQVGHALSWRHLYFTFVTLTTLGYGDVLPTNMYAETLVVIIPLPISLADAALRLECEDEIGDAL